VQRPGQIQKLGFPHALRGKSGPRQNRPGTRFARWNPAPPLHFSGRNGRRPSTAGGPGTNGEGPRFVSAKWGAPRGSTRSFPAPLVMRWAAQAPRGGARRRTYFRAIPWFSANKVRLSAPRPPETLHTAKLVSRSGLAVGTFGTFARRYSARRAGCLTHRPARDRRVSPISSAAFPNLAFAQGSRMARGASKACTLRNHPAGTSPSHHSFQNPPCSEVRAVHHRPSSQRHHGVTPGVPDLTADGPPTRPAGGGTA